MKEIYNGGGGRDREGERRQTVEHMNRADWSYKIACGRKCLMKDKRNIYLYKLWANNLLILTVTIYYCMCYIILSSNPH